jgi:hypothetical protein
MGVKHAPDFDVIGLLEVEDQIRMPLARPEAQPGKIQLECVPGRTGRRPTLYVVVGRFERIDESERCRRRFRQ